MCFPGSEFPLASSDRRVKGLEEDEGSVGIRQLVGNGEPFGKARGDHFGIDFSQSCAAYRFQPPMNIQRL